MSGEVKENKMGVMPVNKLLLSMAIPMMISMLVQAMYNIVDSIFVAKLSEEALTAVSLAFPLQSLMISVCTGLCVGMNALLSRYLGAKDSEGVNKSALNGLLLILIGYLIFLFVGLFLIPTFMYAQTPIESIAEQGITYTKIVSICSIAFFAQMSFERLLQATGRTLYTMCTQTTGAVINIILDPILIFGLFGMPKLGVAGAAIATVIGQTIAALMALTFNIKKNHDIHLHFKGFRPSSRTIGKILSVGIPSILMASMGSVMTFGMNKILMTFSATAIAVFGSYFKLQSFIFMPVFGLNNGMVPIIAFSYGARKRDRMVKTIKLSIAYAVCIMIIGFAIMQIFPDKLLLMFNASESMLSIGVPALRTISVSFLFAGISIVSLSVFQALGHGILSMMVSFMRQLIFLLPSAYLLSLTGDIDKVWYSFLIAEVISVSLSLLSMRYLYKKVIKNL